MAYAQGAADAHVCEVRNALEASPGSCLDSMSRANAPRKAAFTLVVALSRTDLFIERHTKGRWYVRGAYADTIRRVMQVQDVGKVLVASNVLRFHSSIGAGRAIRVYLTPTPLALGVARKLQESPTDALRTIIDRARV